MTYEHSDYFFDLLVGCMVLLKDRDGTIRIGQFSYEPGWYVLTTPTERFKYRKSHIKKIIKC